MLQLAVVIVTHNSAAVVDECLASIAAGCRGLGEYAVLVVDNASTDNSVEVVRARTSSERVVPLESNTGYAAAVNAGVRSVAADTYLVLNPDVRLLPDAAYHLHYAARSTGVAVPHIVDGAGRLDHSLHREPSIGRAFGESLLGGKRAGRFAALGETIVDPSVYNERQVVDWASGAAVMISGECFAATGTWDESFFLYSEETDFMLRARDHGYAVTYEPAASAVHLGGESGEVPALWALLIANKYALFARRHGWGVSWMFRLALVLGETLRSFRHPTHRAAARALVHRDPCAYARARVKE